MKLNSILLTPPGGWRYRQPETGFWSKAITFESLIRSVAQHRQNNGLRMVAEGFDTLPQELEDWLCKQMTPDDQTRLCTGGVRSRESIGWREIVGFIESNAQFIADGGQQVPQDEAERRASICSTCPLNVNVDGCGVCKRTVDEYREKFLHAQPTSYETQLRACGVCGCDLRSIVHFPLKALRAKGDHDFPDWCWQKRGGIQEVPDESLG
jgi:hypothetical protein